MNCLKTSADRFSTYIQCKRNMCIIYIIHIEYTLADIHTNYIYIYTLFSSFNQCGFFLQIIIEGQNPVYRLRTKILRSYTKKQSFQTNEKKRARKRGKNTHIDDCMTRG